MTNHYMKWQKTWLDHEPTKTCGKSQRRVVFSISLTVCLMWHVHASKPYLSNALTYRKCSERVLLTIRNHKCDKSLRVCVKLPYYNMYLDSCDLLEQLIMKLLDSTVPHIIMINIKTFKFCKTFEISGKKKSCTSLDGRPWSPLSQRASHH